MVIFLYNLYIFVVCSTFFVLDLQLQYSEDLEYKVNISFTVFPKEKKKWNISKMSSTSVKVVWYHFTGESICISFG